MLLISVVVVTFGSGVLVSPCGIGLGSGVF
jgi:hypothetical protein